MHGRRLLVAIAAILLLVTGVFVGMQPLDSGDNFCGNAFVSRGHNHQFNGCDDRLTQQRVFVGLMIGACAVLTLVAVRSRSDAAQLPV